MDIFGNTSSNSGCFSVWNVDGSPSGGARLQMPTRTIPSSAADPLVVTGYSISESETLSFAKTFGGTVYTYAFGHNPSASILRVSMVGFLLENAGRVIHDAYKSGRVSESAGIAVFTDGGGNSLAGLVSGLSGSSMQSAASLQRYEVAIALPEAQ